jgi:hypothetical protein
LSIECPEGIGYGKYRILFAEKSGLDVAVVFCIARCGNFNLFDDREIAQCLRGSRFLEIGWDSVG